MVTWAVPVCPGFGARAYSRLYPDGVRVYGEPCSFDPHSGPQKGYGFGPYLELAPNRGVSIQWTLDPFTLDHSVDRSARAQLTAGLPPRLSVLLLRDIDELPFPMNDFAVPGECPLWQDSQAFAEDSDIALPFLPFAKSWLKLTPNGREEYAMRYELASVKSHCVSGRVPRKLQVQWSMDGIQSGGTVIRMPCGDNKSQSGRIWLFPKKPARCSSPESSIVARRYRGFAAFHVLVIYCKHCFCRP